MRAGRSEEPFLSDSYPRLGRAQYALGILMMATFTALLDRYLIGLLLEPIQEEMLISDFQASLLQGLAFAAFYSVLGLPFGMLVDRSNRRNIIIAGTIIWSITTMTCGLAPDYGTLFMSRLGVGIGEACLAPAAYSLITDLFRPRYHGRAFAYYALGSIVGGGGSFILGAKALDLATWASTYMPFVLGVAPWRLTFIIVGSPGLIVGLLLLTFSEPVRQGRKTEDKPSFRELFGFLSTVRFPMSALVCNATAASIAGTGVTSWLAVFLSRTYGLPPSEGGLWIGFAIICSAVLGSPIAGWLTDHERVRALTGRKINVLILGSVLNIPLSFIFPLAPTVATAMVLFLIHAVTFNIHACTLPSALQDLVPNRYKGQVSALYWMVVGLVGLGTGSSVVALVTDGIFEDPTGLRYSLMIVGPGGMAVALVFAFISRTAYDRAIKKVEAERSV